MIIKQQQAKQSWEAQEEKKLVGDEQCFKLEIAVAQIYNQYMRVNVSLRTYWLTHVRSKLDKNTLVHRNHVYLLEMYVIVFCRMIILREII